MPNLWAYNIRPKDFFEPMNIVFYCSLLRSDTFCYVTEQGKP